MDYIKAMTFPSGQKWSYSFSHVELFGVRIESREEYQSEKDALKALIDKASESAPNRRVVINTRGNSAAWGLNVPDNVTIKQGI